MHLLGPARQTPAVHHLEAEPAGLSPAVHLEPESLEPAGLNPAEAVHLLEAEPEKEKAKPNTSLQLQLQYSTVRSS